MNEMTLNNELQKPVSPMDTKLGGNVYFVRMQKKKCVKVLAQSSHFKPIPVDAL